MTMSPLHSLRTAAPLRRHAPALALVGCLTACIEFKPDDDALNMDLPDLPDVDAGELPGGPTVVPAGIGIGGECVGDEDCRRGLVCDDEECQPTGETQPGDRCTVSVECEDGQCIDGRCVEAGEGAIGDACQSTAECAAGLRCGVSGLSARCQPEGDGDALSKCELDSDCMASLACYEGKCQPTPGGAPSLPPSWDGVECEAPSEDSVTAFFEVPGAAGADEGDYFRLPFPNDILTDSRGRVELSGFPTPGRNPVVGIDPLKLYVDAVDGTEGWGTNPTVIFRFSGEISFRSFDSASAVHWLDITDPAQPINAGTNYRYDGSNTKYVCSNHFSVRRRDGSPLEPGHTYAVWLGTDGRDAEGNEIERSRNFEAMLEDSVPGDAVLADAHEKFAPFRDYLEQNGEFDADDVLVATVITVGPVRDLMRELAEAVEEEPVPEVSDWVLCGSGEDSPCPQAEGDRACGEGSSDHDEYHALVELPIFQEGTAPYIESGGDIDTSGPVRSEPVCLSLSVPKGEMPSGGWPLVVFGHGTGGSFRSHIRPEVAGVLADVRGLPELPEADPEPVPVADAGADAGSEPPPNYDGPVPFAVLGYDAVAHGPRRGDSDEHPNHLFFNFLNPGAARGNPLQGAADILSIARMASELDVSAEETGGDAIKIDPNRIVFFGHSQGSIHGNLALPYAPWFKAAVLSGNGVSLMHALLTKTEPENIAAVLPFVLGETDETYQLRGRDHHPALTVVQQYIDPSDGLNFTQYVREPPEGVKPKHIFQTYGLDDHYSPPLTMRIYAMAAELQVVEADTSADTPDELPFRPLEPPVSGTFADDEGNIYTTAMRQYGAPVGSDGHFVVFDVPTANRDMVRFLGMAVRGQVPEVGE